MQAWQGTPATRIPEGAFPSMGPDVASPGKGQEDSAGAVGLEVEASPRHFPSDSQDLAATDLHMQAPFPLGYGHTQNRRQLLAKCFAFWSARTVQNLKAEQHRKRTLLSGSQAQLNRPRSSIPEGASPPPLFCLDTEVQAPRAFWRFPCNEKPSYREPGRGPSR
ncbi:uncharacterized protein LOC114590086 [Podarcis muralis]